MKRIRFASLLMLTACITTLVNAQGNKEIKMLLNEDGSHYIKFTFLNQTWLRFNESNPGTTVMSENAPQTFDIGLRRTRMQLFGQATDRMFFYMQFGMNNFNYLSANAGNRKLQAFFHDALGEYHVFTEKPWLKFGAGLTICNGLSRFSQPSVSSIMTMDVPVFAQTTVDQIDEFSRKLSVYARGQLGRLDYRIALSDPFPITTNGAPAPALGTDATFTPIGHHKQYQGFFTFNFLEKEPHTTPYMTGTYLGKKKILNLEAGLITQQRATWHVHQNDTVFNDLLQWSVGAYLDIPVNAEKGIAVNAYVGYFSLDYGKNYIRNNGIMNPANGVNANSTFNGTGNAYPMFGTGNYVYSQAGFLFKNNLLGKLGTLMPYASVQYATLQKLDAAVWVFDAGINWLISGHHSKVSINYQSRPVFDLNAAGALVETQRKSCVVLQYQVFI